ncbi:DUF1150 family protein [Thalassovita sp.]|jgi:hypothetical protein|uniref:DUF1150 family protein n=1 Tax=Thalassovita sp. TaxID=1979401 RepID=UPI003B5A6D96
MDTKYDFDQDAEDRIVYVRRVNVADLPEELQEAVEGEETLYAVHSAEGERLAVVKDRKLAFLLARQHEYEPVAVH